MLDALNMQIHSDGDGKLPRGLLGFEGCLLMNSGFLFGVMKIFQSLLCL